MTAPLLYVTGTNTGVGKTTLSRLLLQRARERGLRVGAMKPFCTGGREDAEHLHALQTVGLSLDELNPFHFADPVTPYIAARNENRRISLTQVLEAVKNIESKKHPVLIEGAGGLMSPLGDRFTLLDVINHLPGKIAIVAPNILGVLNAAILTHEALRKTQPVANPRFILMSPSTADAASATNPEVLRDWTGATTVEFPFLHDAQITPALAALLDESLDWWFK